MSDQTVGVLLYSDDIDTRRAVMDGVGLRPGKDSPKVEWSEAATPAGALELMRTGHFAALVLDGEATKQGGMSLAKEIAETFDDVPPVIMLTARQQDDWLATWAGAVATIPDPLDPIVLQETLAAVLEGQL